MKFDDVKYYVTNLIKQLFPNVNTLNKLSESQDGKLLFNSELISVNTPISQNSNNAIEQIEDGIFVDDKTSELLEMNDTVQSFRQMQESINYQLDYLSINDVYIPSPVPTVTANSNIISYFKKSYVYSNNITITPDNYITLNPNKTYKLSYSFFSNANNVELHVKDRNGKAYGGRGYLSTTAYNANNMELVIKTSDVPIEIYIYSTGNFVIWPELSYINVEEIGRNVLIEELLTQEQIDEAVTNALTELEG